MSEIIMGMEFIGTQVARNMIKYLRVNLEKFPESGLGLLAPSVPCPIRIRTVILFPSVCKTRMNLSFVLIVHQSGIMNIR